MAKRNASRLLRPLISALVILALVLIFYADEIPGAIQNFTAAINFSRAIAATPEDGEIFVHVIDVGQGDSILVCSGDGNILIDTGTNDSEATVVEYLRACGVKTIDYLICSHAHSDHIGGADAVLRHFEVKTLIMPSVYEGNLDLDSMYFSMGNAPIEVINPSRGDIFTLGDVTFTALTPIGSFTDENDLSLVMRMTYKNASFLFTGDISEDMERELMEAYSTDELDCDFLKIAHHGADSSTSVGFIAEVTPKVAAVSCGKYNSFGHPRREVLKRLSEGGCKEIYRTDKMGNIIIRCDGEEISLVATREAYDSSQNEYR